MSLHYQGRIYMSINLSSVGNPSILGIGKAIPPYFLSQQKLAETVSNLMQLGDEESWVLERIYKNSAIHKRYSVIPDIMDPRDRFRMNSPELRTVGMSERNGVYKKEAPQLAERAARTAIKNWKGSIEEITHILSVSCTGAMSPGIEYILSRCLGVNSEASLLGINFMGCFGSFKALKVATKIAKDNPKNRILLVSTELCTLHFKPRGDIESTVIQSLFADGSAAVIIGCEPRKQETAVCHIQEEHSYFINDSMQDMTWDASDEGFDMKLSQRVPVLINEHIPSFVQKLIGSEAELNQHEWAIHPGGKSIVEAIEKSLSLDRARSISSWNVLNNYGNLSSATILYVLEDILNRPDSKKNIISLGFGPGLSIEGLKLQKQCV